MCSAEPSDKVPSPNSIWANFVAEFKELKSQDGAESAGRRDTYVTPKLKVFGPVGALTPSGPGVPTEMAGEIASMKVMG